MNQSKQALWIGRVLTGLAALPFAASCIMKFVGGPQIVQGMAHYGWPQTMLVTLGILEAVSVILYVLPRTSVLGAIVLTGFLGGAIATHLRVGEPVWIHTAIGIAIWLGLYLRESRLHVLLPVRGDDFHYEREITIDRSSEAVFEYLRLLKNFNSWNPFIRDVTNVKIDGRGTDGEVGFVGSWEGDRRVGAGEQEITRVQDDKQIDFDLRFKRPFKACNTGYFAVDSLDGGRSRVRWGMRGQTTFPMSFIALFINCEKICCEQFESGLRRLKDILEGNSKSQKIG